MLYTRTVRLQNVKTNKIGNFTIIVNKKQPISMAYLRERYQIIFGRTNYIIKSVSRPIPARMEEYSI